MKMQEIIKVLEAEVLYGSDTSIEIEAACGSDMMSDALAFVKHNGMLLTGLVNPQAIRTAEMLDMLCICFVRGKKPTEAMLDLAQECGVMVISTAHRMFTACGLLYEAGLRGGND